MRASVVSLGDARSYYLSTAQNELGVVYAKSVAGAQQHSTAQHGTASTAMQGASGLRGELGPCGSSLV